MYLLVLVRVHLILFKLPIYQQAGLFLHLLCDSVSHRVIRLESSSKRCTAILIVHVLFSISVK